MNPVAAFDRLNMAAKVEDSMAEVRQQAAVDSQRLMQNIVAIAAQQRANEFDAAQSEAAQSAQYDRALLNEQGEVQRAAARNAIEAARFNYQREHDKVTDANGIMTRALSLNDPKAAEEFLNTQGRPDLIEEVNRALRSKASASNWKAAVEAARRAATMGAASQLRSHPSFDQFGSESVVSSLEEAARVAEQKRRLQADAEARRAAAAKDAAAKKAADKAKGAAVSDAQARLAQNAIISAQKQLSGLDPGDPREAGLKAAIDLNSQIVSKWKNQGKADAVSRLREALGLGAKKP